MKRRRSDLYPNKGRPYRGLSVLRVRFYKQLAPTEPVETFDRVHSEPIGDAPAVAPLTSFLLTGDESLWTILDGNNGVSYITAGD